MAEMVPDRLSVVDDATRGEKEVFEVFKRALKPDTDFIVWYEPKILDRYTDFIVWSQAYGLMVVEVKDWKRHAIRSVTQKHWVLNTTTGPVHKRHPIEQSRAVANRLMDLLRRQRNLVHQSGFHRGGLLFPVNYCTIFTRLSRQELLHPSYAVDTSGCLFREDLQIDPQDPSREGGFLSRLVATNRVVFPFRRLTPSQVDLLRATVFNEVRFEEWVGPEDSAQDEQHVLALDREQEQIAKSLGPGHRVVNGVAGSGKTLVVAGRARYLAQLHPDWRILVVCFGRTLAAHLRRLVVGNDGIGDGVELLNFHQLPKVLTGKGCTWSSSKSEEKWEQEPLDILEAALDQGSLEEGCFDAILVDEGQDMHPDWISMLTRLLNPVNNSLLFCYDASQNVFGRRGLTWKSVGVEVHGKRPSIFGRNYRNTVEILEMARRFAVITPPAPGTHDEVGVRLFPTTVADRHGPTPELVKCCSRGDVVMKILDSIGERTDQGLVRLGDTAVIYMNKRTNGFPREFQESFGRRFGGGKLEWVTKSSSTKSSFDTRSDKAKLITAQSAKGLEFRNVYLVGADHLPSAKGDEEVERRLVYVALTRSQFFLTVLYEQESRFIRDLIGCRPGGKSDPRARVS